jgi:hypothetical protein
VEAGGGVGEDAQRASHSKQREQAEEECGEAEEIGEQSTHRREEHMRVPPVRGCEGVFGVYLGVGCVWGLRVMQGVTGV